MSDPERRAEVKRKVEAILDRQAVAKYEPSMVVGCDVGPVDDPCFLAAETALKCLGCGRIVGLVCVGHEVLVERLRCRFVHSCGAVGFLFEIVETIPLAGWV